MNGLAVRVFESKLGSGFAIRLRLDCRFDRLRSEDGLANVRARGPQQGASQGDTQQRCSDWVGQTITLPQLYRDSAIMKDGAKPFRPPPSMSRGKREFRMPCDAGIQPGGRIAKAFTDIVAPFRMVGVGT